MELPPRLLQLRPTHLTVRRLVAIPESVRGGG
jgi:hypothetical protein